MSNQSYTLEVISHHPQLERCLRSLLDLHVLMSTGLGDSPAADEIRDQSEKDWHECSSVEHKLLGWVSEALYSDDEYRTKNMKILEEMLKK